MGLLNELHVCIAPNGHKLSVDCWCEPTIIFWRRSPGGVAVLVVEHEDTEDISVHHNGILIARDRAQDWVTRALNLVGHFPTDPNEPNPKELP
jgi:hypothetical protein